MSYNSSTQVVPAGAYFGFSLSDLETELDNYIAARKVLTSKLVGASVAGQSFQFAEIEKQRAELDRKQHDIQEAFYFLDPGRFPFPAPTNAAAATFI